MQSLTKEGCGYTTTMGHHLCDPFDREVQFGTDVPTNRTVHPGYHNRGSIDGYLRAKEEGFPSRTGRLQTSLSPFHSRIHTLIRFF